MKDDKQTGRAEERTKQQGQQPVPEKAVTQQRSGGGKATSAVEGANEGTARNTHGR